jgi:transcriptional regulator GlxA family with amidase domain
LLPRGVRRALDAMRANAGHDWSVNELAEAAGLSSRTLQRQFREFLGKSPRAALRDVRFENARRELLQGIPDAKVMDVAQRWRNSALRAVFRRVPPPFWRNAVTKP